MMITRKIRTRPMWHCLMRVKAVQRIFLATRRTRNPTPSHSRKAKLAVNLFSVVLLVAMVHPAIAEVLERHAISDIPLLFVLIG